MDGDLDTLCTSEFTGTFVDKLELVDKPSPLAAAIITKCQCMKFLNCQLT